MEMPSRSEEISHGVVEPRSIGSQSVEAIAGDDEEARGLTRQHPKRWGGRRGIPRS